MPAGGVERRPPGKRLLSNVAWNLAGIVAYNLSQWLLIVAVARAIGHLEVGQFALALAISAPVYLTVGLHLRIVRATDVRRVWSAGQYTRLRVALNVVAAVLSLAIGLSVGIRGTQLVVLALVCASKAVEATSQVMYGFFQIRERLDLVARSLLLRALLGSGGFIGLAFATGNLPWACLGLTLGWFAVFLVHDRPQHGALLATDHEAAEEEGIQVATEFSPTRALALKALPLGFDAGVGSLATNIPRYGVQIVLGTAALGSFAALAYLAQIVSFITGALGDTVVGRLAILHEQRSSRAFWRLLGLVLLFGFGVTVLATLGAALIGPWVIGHLLGAKYVNQPVLITLMIGAGFITFQRSLARALYAGHRYSSALVVNTAVLIAAGVFTALLVPRFHLVGAAATLGMAFIVGSLVTFLLIWRSRSELGWNAA